MTFNTNKAKRTLAIALLGTSLLSTAALANTPKAQDSALQMNALPVQLLQMSNLPVQLNHINKNINEKLNTVAQKQTLQQINGITNELSEQISINAHSILTNNVNH
ncbi:hypothetical protein [Thalassotalea fusca]